MTVLPGTAVPLFAAFVMSHARGVSERPTVSAKTTLTSALALFAFAAVPATALAGPYDKGPDPTVDTLRDGRGPYAYTKKVISNAATPGFGSAAVWSPVDAPGQTFGAVAIAPGFTESESVISWLGPKLASNGFVVITINVNNTLTDLPDSRGVQLNAALKYLTTQSAVKDQIDPNRLAVAGHSMGGGAVLEAAKRNPALKAAVGLEPWNLTTNWGGIKTPSLMIGAQNDIIAPPASHAIKFYNSLPATLPKAYFQIRGADHFVSNTPNQAVGTATLSWLKRYVDEDTRYGAVLAPNLIGPAENLIQTYVTKNVS